MLRPSRIRAPRFRVCGGDEAAHGIAAGTLPLSSPGEAAVDAGGQLDLCRPIACQEMR
jgi:hypothetical protein